MKSGKYSESSQVIAVQQFLKLLVLKELSPPGGEAVSIHGALLPPQSVRAPFNTTLTQPTLEFKY